MKPKFILPVLVCLLFCTRLIFAQLVYYVSAEGNDSLPGTSEAAPWKTLAKVNTALGSLSTGDQVLFKRGDRFEGQLRVTQSGIIFGAYGSGAKPVLTGARPVAGTWTEVAPQLWETTLPDPPSEVRNLFLEDTPLPLSRYPGKSENNGYFNMESSVGKTQFTDNDLTGDWLGADIVVRAEKYRLVRTKVTAQNNKTLTIASHIDIINDLRNRAGYFFCNDRRAIDEIGEWAYEAPEGKLVVKQTSAPEGITFSAQDTVVYVSGADNLVMEDIMIAHGNFVNIYIRNSSNVMLRTCRISDAGGDAILFDNVQSLLCEYNEIDAAVWNGITVLQNCSGAIVRENTITNIGNELFGKSKVYYGIYNLAAGTHILKNHLENILGIGILATGEETLVKRNVVDNANFGLEDYGSIYTNYNLASNVGMVIEENIVRNSTGERAGMPDPNSQAQGIYADNNSQGVTIRNNTVYNVAGSAYYFNSYDADNRLIGNTAFGPGQFELEMKNTKAPGYNVEVADNLFVPNTDDRFHRSILVLSKEYPRLSNGPFRNNRVLHLYDSESVNSQFKEDNIERNGWYTPHEWNFSSDNASGNRPAPLRYEDPVDPEEVLLFFVNPSDSALTVSLPSGHYLDADATGYSATTVIAPFRSLVLLKYSGDVSTMCTVPAGLQADSITDVSVKLEWNAVSGSINYDIRYRQTGAADWEEVYYLPESEGFVVKSLEPAAAYEWQVRARCFQGPSDWSVAGLFTTLATPPALPPSNPATKELLGTSTFLTWDQYLPAGFYQARYRLLTDSVWIQTDSTAQTQVFISGLTPVADYEFEVRSRTVSGWSPWSASSQFTTLPGGILKRIIAESPNQWIVRDRTTGVRYINHSTALFIGRASAATESGIAVFPFRFPGLAPGQQLMEAELTLRVTKEIQEVKTELWGIPFRSSPAYDLEDYYDVAFSGANQANATVIQERWLETEGLDLTKDCSVNLKTSGRERLANYLQTQYQNGADGNKWFFLRINPTGPYYDFRVMLLRGENTNLYKPHVSVILTPAGEDLSEAVDSLAASVNGAGNIVLSWNTPSPNTSGLILEKRTGDGYYRTLTTLSATDTSYVDNIYSSGEIYRYRLLAYNANGSKGFSNEAIVIYTLSPPSELSGSIAPSDQMVRLSWKDSNVNKSYFVIERKSGEGTFSIIGNADGSSESFADTSSVGVTFPLTYRIKTIFNGQSSAYSEELVIDASDYEVADLFTAGSSINGSAASPPVYQYVSNPELSVLKYPTFYPTNLAGGCYYAVQAVFVQTQNAYMPELNTYLEFELKSSDPGLSLLISQVEVKARKAAGETYTMKYRIAYSIDGGAFVDNGADLIPTAVGCTAAGYGSDFKNLVTQTWNIPGLHLSNPASTVRFRIYYFDQSPYASMGLPFVNVRGALLPVTTSDPLTFTVSTTPEECPGLENAALTVAASGGRPPYHYTLNTGQSGPDGIFSGLSAGRYLLSVADSQSEIRSDSVFIDAAPRSLYVLLDIAGEQLLPGDSVIVTPLISGGTPPYRLLWPSHNSLETAQLNTLVTNTAELTFECTAEDARGCRASVDTTLYINPVKLQVLSKAGDSGGSPPNAIYNNFSIVNEGADPLMYENLSVRYWLSPENYDGEMYKAVDYAALGAGNILMEYIASSDPRENTLGYIAYNFSPQPGNYCQRARRVLCSHG